MGTMALERRALFLTAWLAAAAACGGGGASVGEVVPLGAGAHARLAVAPDGVAVAAWHDGDRIVARAYDPAAGWGAATTLFEGKRRADDFPAPWVDPLVVAIDATGRAVVAWNDWDAEAVGNEQVVGVADIWAARFDPAQAWGEARLVLSIDTSSEPGWMGVRAAVAPDGVATIAGAGAEGVWAVRGDRAGAWAAPDRLAEGGIYQLLGVVAGPDGATEVVWVAQEGGLELVARSARREPGGAWAAPTQLRRLRQGGFFSFPAVMAAGRDGSAVLLWRDDGLRTSRLDPVAGWGEPELLDPRGSLGVQDAAIGGDGTVVTTWYASSDLGGFARFRPGAGWSVVPLDAPSGTRLAIDGRGDAVAVWRVDSGILAAVARGSSSWSTPALLVPIARPTASVHVGLDGDGNGLLVWRQEPCDYSRCAIHAAPFTP